MSLVSLMLTDPSGSGLDPIRKLVLEYLRSYEGAQLESKAIFCRTRNMSILLSAAHQASCNWKALNASRLYARKLPMEEQLAILSPLIDMLCRECGDGPRQHVKIRFAKSRNDLCSTCYFHEEKDLIKEITVLQIIKANKVPSVNKLTYMTKGQTNAKGQMIGPSTRVWRRSEVENYAWQKDMDRVLKASHKGSQKGKKRKLLSEA